MLVMLLRDLSRWDALNDFINGDIFLSWEVFLKEYLKLDQL